jgi:hypothetical protein
MRLIATNDPSYLTDPAAIIARRDAYAALCQVTFLSR